jgi:hypothetical protein
VRTKVQYQEYVQDQFGLCGCSDGAAAVDLIGEVLVALDRKRPHRPEDPIPTWDALKKRFHEEDDPGIYYLVMGALEREGLIEHGTSIRGSWTTDAGRELVAEIEEYGTEEL